VANSALQQKSDQPKFEGLETHVTPDDVSRNQFRLLAGARGRPFQSCSAHRLPRTSGDEDQLHLRLVASQASHLTRASHDVLPTAGEDHVFGGSDAGHKLYGALGCGRRSSARPGVLPTLIVQDHHRMSARPAEVITASGSAIQLPMSLDPPAGSARGTGTTERPDQDRRLLEEVEAEIEAAMRECDERGYARVKPPLKLITARLRPARAIPLA
jgi:hypothetical protein